MPPPDPNNPVDPDIVTFHVQVTDSDFNVVTKAITVDRTGVAPPADTPSDQLVKSYAGIFADKADAMASLSAKALEAEAERLQAVQQNDQELVAALVEVIRDLTDQIQAYIASIESTSGQAVQRLLNV